MLAVEDGIVAGLISPPALHRASREHVVILLNGRRIHHRNLAFAVEQAYRGLREPDRYPLAVLDLRVDPAEVDVNVHPTKREVRFRNEGAIFGAVERACYRALRQSPIYELQSSAGGPLLELRETSPHPSPPPQAGEGMESREARWTEGAEGRGARPRLPPPAFIGQLLRRQHVAEASGAV